MDVRKWLNETVLPNPRPGPPRNHPSQSFGSLEHPQPVSKRKSRRRRGKSDSPLLEPPPPPPSPPPQPKLAAKKRKPPTEGGTDESTHSEGPPAARSESSRSNPSSQCYARKPRRKTHPERYEPPPKRLKGWGNRVHPSRKGGSNNRKGEPNKSRHAPRRTRAEQSGNGIGYDFHAKNVSGHRLTLKPREQPGIFNKGRTSTAVKGRGLPDLVFSEMKFLQKHSEQPEVMNQSEAPRERRTKDRVRSQEGEISAYFSTVRPAHIEKDGNCLQSATRLTQVVSPGIHRRQQKRSSVDHVAFPIIEAHETTTFLSFGSRGPCHTSTSHLSWSESIRANSMAPAQPLGRDTAIEGSLEVRDRNERTTAPTCDVSFEQLAPRSASRQRPEGPIECFGVSSLDFTHHQISRSYSFPPHASSPRQAYLANPSTKVQTADRFGSPSSMPPFAFTHTDYDAPRSRLTSMPNEAKVKKASMQKDFPFNQNTNQENVGVGVISTSSSDLGRTLQHCNVTLQHRSHMNAILRQRTAQTNLLEPKSRRRQRHTVGNAQPVTEQLPTVRVVGGETHIPTVPTFAGADIYRPQVQRRQDRFQSTVEDVAELPCSEQQYVAFQDDVARHSRIWGEVPEAQLSWGFKEEDGNGEEPDSYGIADMYAADDFVQHISSENSVVAPGFWRPNRLY